LYRRYDNTCVHEIRGSGFSAKSSDFLPPKRTMNAGLGHHIKHTVSLKIKIYIFSEIGKASRIEETLFCK
jgi:hypothetical protein